MKTISKRPVVSIIMPSFNSQKSILNSIGSVINQTYNNWELIIVDDCSTDDTVKLITQIDDARIRVIKLLENSGSPATPRNVGIDISIGEYIAFLDSDDRWRENKLEVQIQEMLKYNSQFSCSGYSLLRNNVPIKRFMPPIKSDYKMLLSNNTVGCLTAILDKKLLDGIRFPKCGHEDYAMWLKILKKNNYVLGVQYDLAEYNLLPGSVSSSKIKMIPFFWNIYRNQEGFSYMLSLYFCLKYLINVIFFKYKK